MSHDVKLDLKYETFYTIYPINGKKQRETNQNMHIPQVIALLKACIIYDTPGTSGLRCWFCDALAHLIYGISINHQPITKTLLFKYIENVTTKNLKVFREKF